MEIPAGKPLTLGAVGSGLKTQLLAGAAVPEGNVAAPTGTIYQRVTGAFGEGVSLWVKETGTGNTGWRAVTHPPATAANLASAAHNVNTIGKYESRQAFDTTNDRPVWASGAAATAPWKYADGTVAVTPV